MKLRGFIFLTLLVFACAPKSNEKTDSGKPQPATTATPKNQSAPNGSKPNPNSPNSSGASLTCGPDEIPTAVIRNKKKENVCWDGLSNLADESITIEEKNG